MPLLAPRLLAATALAAALASSGDAGANMCTYDFYDASVDAARLLAAHPDARLHCPASVIDPVCDDSGLYPRSRATRFLVSSAARVGNGLTVTDPAGRKVERLRLDLVYVKLDSRAGGSPVYSNLADLLPRVFPKCAKAAAVIRTLDASVPVAPPSPPSDALWHPAPRPVDRGAMASTLGGVAVNRCAQPNGPVGPGTVRVTFAPDGRVKSATVEGAPFEGTTVGDCIAASFRNAVRVPPFTGADVTVTKAFSVTR
jgi:hypothetical protein